LDVFSAEVLCGSLSSPLFTYQGFELPDFVEIYMDVLKILSNAPPNISTFRIKGTLQTGQYAF
jgi:hypothetical protein